MPPAPVNPGGSPPTHRQFDSVGSRPVSSIESLLTPTRLPTHKLTVLLDPVVDHREGTAGAMPGLLTRRAVLATGITGIGGAAALPRICRILPGERVPNPAENPCFGAVRQVGDLQLSSPAFSENGQLPNKYGHAFQNISPPLTITGVPDEARTLALVMDGPDVPGGEFAYWLVWNIPPDIGTIPEGWELPESVIEGRNSSGHSDSGYYGPGPPNRQTYRFKLFAVDITVPLPRGATKQALGVAIDGHIVAQTQLTVWYDFHSSAHDTISREGHINLIENLCVRL